MRALKGARFILASFVGGGVDCRIVDIHSRGARLRFDIPVPFKGGAVEMIIFPENKYVKGRMAWQRGLEMGVEFDKPLEWLVRHDVPFETAGAQAPAA